MKAVTVAFIIFVSSTSFAKIGDDIATFRLKTLESREVVEQIVRTKKLSKKSAKGLRLMNQEKVKIIRDLCQLDLAANQEQTRSVASESFLEGCYAVNLTSWIQYLREGILANEEHEELQMLDL